MEKRKKLSEDILKMSQSTKKAYGEAQEQYKKLVAKANEEAILIIGKANENAKLVSDEIKKKAEENSKAILARAEEAIAKEHTTLKTELEKEIGALVLDTVQKVVGELPAEQQEKIRKNIDSKFVK